MNPHSDETTYGQAIREGFAWLMRNHKEVFVIGQGLWSPWYVGNSMTDLDIEFGRERVLDTPVSEAACTGAAMGAALCGYRPIVVHPRMDFMLLAVDQIVNQAAKWNHMLGGRASPRLTVRGIINRGGEQGAQHSQALHAWFAHVPGLRVVMPATAADARDLLIASVLCDDPVVYVDDRWLYDERQRLEPTRAVDLREQGPQRRRAGTDLTLVGASHTVKIALQVAEELASVGISCDVWDLRVISPLRTDEIARSVASTGRLCVLDGAWKTCGLAGEVIASVCENMEPARWRARPLRVTLPDAPAPSSGALESVYYPGVSSVVDQIKASLFTRSN